MDDPPDRRTDGLTPDLPERKTFECPECHATIGTGHLWIAWHAVNKWHNPINALVNARSHGMPLWQLGLAFAIGGAIGFFLIWSLLARVNR